jgi:hypothetical protein
VAFVEHVFLLSFVLDQRGIVAKAARACGEARRMRAVRRGSGTAARRRAFRAHGKEAFVTGPETNSERGKRAGFDRKSGEVHGSGSGAGGGGNPLEDHDSDPMAGAGAEPAGGPRAIDRAEQRPIDPDEGT